jgi:hypothetical protein
MNRLTLMPALLLVTGLQSCQAPSAPPMTPGPAEVAVSASLRVVVVPETAAGNVKEWGTRDCQSGTGREIAKLGSGPNLLFNRGAGKQLAMPLGDRYSATQTVELRIPASRPYHIEVRAVANSRIEGTAMLVDWCSQMLVFTPESGGMYEAIYRRGSGPQAERNCTMEVQRIVPLGGGQHELVAFQGWEAILDPCGRPR